MISTGGLLIPLGFVGGVVDGMLRWLSTWGNVSSGCSAVIHCGSDVLVACSSVHTTSRASGVFPLCAASSYSWNGSSVHRPCVVVAADEQDGVRYRATVGCGETHRIEDLGVRGFPRVVVVVDVVERSEFAFEQWLDRPKAGSGFQSRRSGPTSSSWSWRLCSF